MPDSTYAAPIKGRVQVRASLISLVEAIENKMLAPGMPITIPEVMTAKVNATLVAFDQSVANVNRR
jgi:hypothetical protein